jgi:hypothetical protein
MFLQRKVYSGLLVVLLAGLLVACGDSSDYANLTPALKAGGAATAPAPLSSSNGPVKSTKAAQAGAAQISDPCSLFTKTDFMAIFGKAAADPDRDNFPQWSTCSYQFADPASQAADTAYGLDVKLLKGDFNRQKFEDTYQVLQSRLQKLDGLGDMAYLLPSASADNSTSLFVLKGTASFTLSLLEPTSVTEAQKQTELKAVAQKILARL